MRCINSHSPFHPLPSSHQKHKQQQLKTPTKLLWLSSNEPTSRLQHRPNINPPPLRTQAATTSLVLGVIGSPAGKSGDVSVFLQTSAVLFFAYWMTNFVVPDIISKYLQLEKTSDDDEKPNDNTPLENEQASKRKSSMRRSQAKKRGFNSTKP